MPFEWAENGALWGGKLKIVGLGDPGNNSPTNVVIESLGESMPFVDMLRMTGTISEKVLVSETTVTKASEGDGNAYILPWKTNYLVKTRLGASKDIFVTAQLNGCSIFIGGPITGPTVIHANAQPDYTSIGMPDYDPKNAMSSMSAINQFDLNTRLPRWDSFYGGVAQKVCTLGLLPLENFGILLPSAYMRHGEAAVFGVRTGANWSFYFNTNKTTTKFWPA